MPLGAHKVALFGVAGAEALFSGTATGGTITTSGDWKIHTFTSSGTFEVTDGSGLVEFLAIAGGGGGGGYHGGFNGGGGAGGYRCSVIGENSGGGASAEDRKSVSVGTYTVTIGAGGSGGGVTAYSGSNSVFDDITSTGGGRGGYYDTV